MLQPGAFQTQHLQTTPTCYVQKPRNAKCEFGGPLLGSGTQNVYLISVWLASVLKLVQLLTRTYFSPGNISDFKKVTVRLGEIHMRNIFFLFFLSSTLDLYFNVFLNISAIIAHRLFLSEPLIMF